MMKRLIAALVLGCTALPVQAQDLGCAALLQVFRAEPAPDQPAPGAARCTPGQLGALLRNDAAIRRAQPVTEDAQLYGTWLDDEVLPYVSGVTVPGAEVLTIEPGTVDGQIRVTQHWFTASLPGGGQLPWEAEHGYARWVARGDLTGAGDGTYGPIAFSDGVFAYSNLRLAFERAYELHLMSALNHFDLPVQFARTGDVLVLTSQRMQPLTRHSAPRTQTYTRIAPRSADVAVGLVAVFDLSFAQNFECFVHQLNAGQGPLIEAIKPYDADRLWAWLDQTIGLAARRMALFEQARTTDDPDAVADAMHAVGTELIALNESDISQHLTRALRGGGGDFGCLDIQ